MQSASALSVWAIDLTHSSIGFTVRHMVISKVRGRFASWNGTIAMDERDPSTAQVEITIDAASIDTGVADRDKHLRSADFLETEKFPALTYRGTRVERLAEGRYRLVGDLSLHGVTRPVALEVEYAGTAKDPWGGERAGFTARTSLNRKDFGLQWNVALEAGGFVVGDTLEIDIEVEAVKQQPDVATAAA